MRYAQTVREAVLREAVRRLTPWQIATLTNDARYWDTKRYKRELLAELLGNSVSTGPNGEGENAS